MSFVLHHPFVSRKFTPTRGALGDKTFFTINEFGQFAVLNPGRIQRRLSARFTLQMRVPRPRNEPDDFEFVTKNIPMQFMILTPDGLEFNATEITLTDLQKFRDLRGRPYGLWSYRLTGKSELLSLAAIDAVVTNPRGFVVIGVEETVQSESASPLVNAPVATSRRTFSFDLFRVGTFVARVHTSSNSGWRGTMRLVDPDGVVVKRTTRRILRFEVTVATLGKSRDSAGKARKWKLEMVPTLEVGAIPINVSGNRRVSATVIGLGRLNPAPLKSRIDRMIGPRGSFVKLFGEHKDGEALCRLMITDPLAAETIDMHKLLRKQLSSTDQGDADPKHFQVDTLYTLGRRSLSLSYGLKLDVKTLKVGAIDVEIGRGDLLGPSVPTVTLTVTVSGAAKVKFGRKKVATAKVRGGKLKMEVGIKLDADGTPQVVTGIREKPFDMDIDRVALGLVVAASPVLGGAVIIAKHYIENIFNEKIRDGARNLLADPTLAPSNLMLLMGAHLDYLPPRFEGSDILFEHVAPLEPDPKPRPDYKGVIGRRVIQRPIGTSLNPRTLGNTWAAGNLQKVDHIVVVMMENRSYDHVLGYRSKPSAGVAANPIHVDDGDDSDGLTDSLIAAIQAADGGEHIVRNLQTAGFVPNELGLRTGIPKSPGHHMDDVAEQLAERTVGPGNRQINSPKGFVENFLPKLAQNSEGVVGDDVLGYYDEKALPFFDYLAENYAYSDRYFSAHPGPTLPNRMYSLTGDVQYDRYGVPILNNNSGDNLLLSRGMTIYDLLTRKGVSWRVYESHPSVTMLRMFARYATNNEDIVPIARLRADVARGDLPAFTAIEPAMHHRPQDDDHPVADMYRGQKFVQEVYETLRSNDALWQRTMLIITYDEHGGFYDHVVPPVADLLEVRPGGAGGVLVVGGRQGGVVPPRVLAFNGPLGNVMNAARLPEEVFEVPQPPPPPASPPPTSLSVPYGVRVPTFVVSPWASPGKGPGITLDHCSILKTVIARFASDRPFLSDRVHASQTFNAFLTEAQPRMNVPAAPALRALPSTASRLLPGASRIVTHPLSLKAMREGSVDFHELTGMLARMLGR